MYKNVLQGIENIEIWPLISLTIFFLFFIFLLWWVLTTDKEFIDQMKNLPMGGTNNDKAANKQVSSSQNLKTKQQ